jgi:tetratricopeptide (TPR) repeat protein/predicted aspartyl protease
MVKGRFFAGLLFLGAVAASPALAGGCALTKFVELPVTMEGLVPTVPAKLGGVDVKLIVDSGSFFSTLTPQAAARAGLHVGPSPLGLTDSVIGLGGSERVGFASTTGFSLAGFAFQHADFYVAAPQLARENVDGLLGNNLLSVADVEFDLADGAIRLIKPTGCSSQNNLAYWTTSVETADISPPEKPSLKIIVYLKVNGHPLKAILDSGSPRSYITRAAARAVGVSTDDPGAKPDGMVGGIGHAIHATWVARFDSLAIGDELVKNAMLRIADTDIGATSPGGVQMLLGADFLLSHRVYVANSERKLYFSYIGGPVFNLDQAPDAAGSQTAAAPSPSTIPAVATDTPVDADSLARRAAALDARHDYAAAITDYTRAIALQPTAVRAFYGRAMSHWRNKEPEAALADLTAALKLKPDDEPALLARGNIELERKDEADAAADFEAAAKIKPEDRLVAASWYQSAGLFEKSVAEWGQWIADHPKDLELVAALNGRCWTRALWGKELDQALADCNDALRLAPESGTIRDTRGLVYLRLRQYQASIADYDAALKAMPKRSWSLYGRGIDKLRLGRTADGDADLAAAAAADPNMPETAKKYGVAP